MSPLCVLGTSALTGVGLSAPAMAAAVRGAISDFEEYEFATDRVGEPAIVSAPPGLTEIQCAETAITEMAVAAVKPFADGSALPVFLALPEPRPGLDGNLAETVARALNERVEGARVARPTGFGHAAGGVALRQAGDYLARGESTVAVIVGVDSYLHPETISWLDSNRQLHASYNAWGFIPGAAAGACLVCQIDTAQAQTRRTLAMIDAISITEEEVPLKSDGVCLGRALSQIIKNLSADLSSDQLFDSFYSDLNGEAYRSDELGFMLCRESERFRDPAALISPADCLGDVGAASLPLSIGLAVEAALRDYSPGPISLHLAGSESGLRAGIRMRTLEGST